MPKKIVTVDGSGFRLADYELPELGANQIRVHVAFAAIKHGTELHALGGSAFDTKVWDKELRLFLPKEATDTASVESPKERGIDNMVVGTVIEMGAAVSRWAVGDPVFGYGQVREIAQSGENDWYPQGDMSPSDCLCVDPAHVAFVAVRDGNIRIGDTVAIYGLGAIGLMAVQIARAGGAQQVFAVDPIAIRREHALQNGATAAFDPTVTDAALEIKRRTGGKGVDVSIETSGSGRALHDAIRAIRQCGTVVHVPWGPKEATALHLDEEFHLNRPTIIGSQAAAGWGNPDRSYPLWDNERAFHATIQLFRDKKITGDGIVEPILPFFEVAERLPDLLGQPQSTVKIGFAF